MHLQFQGNRIPWWTRRKSSPQDFERRQRIHDNLSQVERYLDKLEEALTANAGSITQYPHCDQRVLHAPGKCEYCDKYSDWQRLREGWGINYTGEYDPEKLPCPAEVDRSLESIENWSGNQPKPNPASILFCDHEHNDCQVCRSMT